MTNDQLCESGMRFEDGKCVSAKALRDIESIQRRAEKRYAVDKSAKQHSQKYSSSNYEANFTKGTTTTFI